MHRIHGSALVLMSVMVVVSCGPQKSKFERMGYFPLVADCVREAGIRPVNGSAGSFFSPEDSLDTSLEKVTRSYGLTEAQQAAARSCAIAKAQSGV